MSTVSIKVNESKLMQNLGYAFSNSTTVLSETMQNSRRSGADEIRFYFEENENVLTIIDNGNGIIDMQKLLSLADSGWSDEIVKKDRPFGMGWFSVLYASPHIRVESMGQAIDFYSEDALAFSQIEVKSINHGFVGTILELKGFKLGSGIQNVSSLLEAVLEKYAKGFPIRVYLNDCELKRPDALDSDHTFCHYDPIGHMSISGLPGVSNRKPSTSIVAYLQGLPIFEYGTVGYWTTPNIVHLNSEIYQARLPDRDKLIDEEDKIDMIYRRIRNEWRDYFTTLIMTGRGNDLLTATCYETICDFKLHDVFNYVDAIPPSTLSVVCDYPQYHAYDNHDVPLKDCDKLITREMVENGEVILVKHLYMSPDTSPQWMAMYQSDEYYFICDDILPKDHWAMNHVLDWSKVKPEILPQGIVEEKTFNGNWLLGNCFFCDSYRLTIGDFSMVIDSVSLGYGEEYENAVFYVPLKDSGGDVVNHCSSFTSEHDEIDENAREQEEKMFSLFVRFHRESTPSDVIQSLINDASLGRFQGLDGTYIITVTGDSIDVCSSAA